MQPIDSSFKRKTWFRAYNGDMPRWMGPLALLAALLGAAMAAGAGPVAPQATCSLPGTILCTTDPECVAYGAVCNIPAGQCVCPLVGDGGTGDGGTGDGGTARDGGGGGGGSGGPGATSHGGGQTGPIKTGCSFVP